MLVKSAIVATLSLLALLTLEPGSLKCVGALSASSSAKPPRRPWGMSSVDPQQQQQNPSQPSVVVAQQQLQQQPQGRQRRSVDYFGIGTYVGTAVSAGAELVEDFESVGHHHGLLLLVGSKLCREINVLREAFKHGIKEVEHVRWGTRPFGFLLRILTNRVFAMALTLGALAAATVEVFEDAIPGGEHGAILLATNELLELLEAAKVLPTAGVVATVLKNCVFRLFLNAGALAFALYETFESITHRKLGGHHGVALLAFMKTLRTIGLVRTQFKEKHKKKQEIAMMKEKEA